MTLASGTRLGRYEIRSKIGAGGMGEVYLAQDTKLDRKVALKILSADVAANHNRMRRFVQEAKAASALNHPNIITIHEIDLTDSVHFIATEFIDGETLRQRMNGAPIKLCEVLDLAAQIAGALSAAHAAGIVHRDVKPENIMLRRDGIVKVLDFGLAKLSEKADTGTVDTEAATKGLVQTEPGVVVGTAAYMSPEQARGLLVDARTDIFSLGVVIYEMVAGQAPFGGSTRSDLIVALLERDPPPLARFTPEAPAELERLVMKTLVKDREERYQTAKDLLIDLKRLRQRLEVEAEIERTAEPQAKSSEVKAIATDTRQQATETARAAVETGDAAAAPSTSIAAKLVRKIPLHKRGALITLLVAVTAMAAYFAYSRYWAEGRRANIDSAVGIRSIAVLPFTNVSNNPDTEYLSDGISESLINSLSQLPGVKVIARTSSFKYKGKEVDPQEVARALGVDAILTGRVLQRGDDLLIRVELVNPDKTQAWGEQYNRKATDVLQVQSEISREIAEKLRLRLTAGERQQLAKRETVNPQAYELLLKGRSYKNKFWGTEGEKKAIEYFQQAIAVDPAYALAYAELSTSYSTLCWNGILDPKEFRPKAEAAARKALELDESLADAHSALAYLKQQAWEWATAEREYKRAIELNPNLAAAHIGYSIYLMLMGRHDEALAEAKRARELDPLSLFANVQVGNALGMARRYDEAIESLKRSLEMDQSFAVAHAYLCIFYTAKGMYAEAVAEGQELTRLGGHSLEWQIYLGAAYAKAGQRQKAQEILKRLQTTKEYVSPGELPVLYAALGEREQAFASFEKAYAAHDLQLQYLGVDSSFDSLREDPRFKDLMRRVGLTP